MVKVRRNPLDSRFMAWQFRSVSERNCGGPADRTSAPDDQAGADRLRHHHLRMRRFRPVGHWGAVVLAGCRGPPAEGDPATSGEQVRVARRCWQRGTEVGFEFYGQREALACVE